MGEVFAGRYELVDVLDSGGMGTVWRVWDVRDRTYRAAKMLRQSDSVSLLRFVRETATRVEHPHVVAPTGWSAEDDRVLFAMPLVGGGSVATLIADHGPLPQTWVRELTLQLLDALDAVHAAGIVHRDVKPANLLLEPTGTGRPHLRLSDFGIAALIDEPRLTRAADLLHTPGYAAPEAAAGVDPDPRQDLFSVGMVMQEMLTGLRPDAAASPPEIPAALADVWGRLVAADPSARYASAAEAGSALAVVDVVVADDDAIEVFEHVPPLPDGWGAEGRGTSAARAATSPVAEPLAPPREPRRPMGVNTKQHLLAGVLALTGVVLLVAALLAL